VDGGAPSRSACQMERGKQLPQQVQRSTTNRIPVAEGDDRRGLEESSRRGHEPLDAGAQSQRAAMSRTRSRRSSTEIWLGRSDAWHCDRPRRSHGSRAPSQREPRLRTTTIETAIRPSAASGSPEARWGGRGEGRIGSRRRRGDEDDCKPRPTTPAGPPIRRASSKAARGRGWRRCGRHARVLR